MAHKQSHEHCTMDKRPVLHVDYTMGYFTGVSVTTTISTWSTINNCTHYTYTLPCTQTSHMHKHTIYANQKVKGKLPKSMGFTSFPT